MENSLGGNFKANAAFQCCNSGKVSLIWGWSEEGGGKSKCHNVDVQYPQKWGIPILDAWSCGGGVGGGGD